MQRLRHRIRLLALSIVAIAASGWSGADAGELLEALRKPGNFAFMRHAWAPFDGAPRETGRTAETLGPCETQRNLDEKGRADARRINQVFVAAGVTFERAYTSRWCRCVETAELVLGRKAQHLPLIDSYYTSPDKATKGPAQIASLKQFLNDNPPANGPALMVTHGSLISDLTGIDTGEAEIVVVAPDGKGGVTIVARGIP